MSEVPNDVFPEGVNFGYYYNYCQDEEWKDTRLRSQARVCCQEGKYRDCQEIFQEYEDLEAAEEAGGEAGSNQQQGGSSGSSGSNGSKDSNGSSGSSGSNGSNGSSGSSGSDESSGSTEPVSASEETENIKNKILNGEDVTEEEVEKLLEYIAGLRATIEFLTNTADQLEQSLV